MHWRSTQRKPEHLITITHMAENHAQRTLRTVTSTHFPS
ncbi:MAG: hypothetical protein RIQ79_238 [Verrucomicrobiota bacterium]